MKILFPILLAASISSAAYAQLQVRHPKDYPCPEPSTSEQCVYERALQFNLAHKLRRKSLDALMAYQQSRDETKLLSTASELEQDMASSSQAFVLYKWVGNQEGMQRVAKKEFLFCFEEYISSCEQGLLEAGLKITKKLYSERGDYLLSLQAMRHYGALKAYQRAFDSEGIKRAEQEFEKEGNYPFLINHYLRKRDMENARRVARKYFVGEKTHRSRHAAREIKMLEKVGVPATKTLWSERGHHHLCVFEDGEEAVYAFGKSGNKQQITKIIQDREKTHTIIQKEEPAFVSPDKNYRPSKLLLDELCKQSP